MKRRGARRRAEETGIDKKGGRKGRRGAGKFKGERREERIMVCKSRRNH